jgi:hypothetical protein
MKQYWVPEDFMFEDAGTCLEKFPGDGPAALVYSHPAYVTDLYEQNKIMREALELSQEVDNGSGKSFYSDFVEARDRALEKCRPIKTAGGEG